MPTNYLTQFATSGTANLPTESTWQNLTERATGFQTGLARSSYFNRLFAQGANAAYVLGQMVVDYASQDADLDGATLYTNFKTALTGYLSGNYLPLSGGTMTGAITRNGVAIQNGFDNGTVTLYGATAYTKGAYFNLYGKDQATYPGQFRLICNDGSNTYSLTGDPSDGSLKWKGNDIITSSGGVATAGNWLYRSVGTGYLRISGGSSASTGGNVVFRGEGATTNPGGVEFWAVGSSTTASMTILPDSNVVAANKYLVYGKGSHALTNMSAYGYVTADAKQMTLIFPFCVSGSVAAADLTVLSASIRYGNGGYASPGGATPESLIPSGVTKTIGIRDQHLWIQLVRSAGWSVPNNAVVVASTVSLTFAVT